MSLTDAEFHHLCRLARLDPDEETGKRFAAECDAVLTYMAKLSEVDTGGVEPMYSPARHATPMREDMVRRVRTREEILANAPLTDGEFFIVPRIVEGK